MPVLFLGVVIGLIVSAFVAVASSIASVLAIVVPIFVQVFNVIKFVVSRIGVRAGRFFRFIAGAVRGVFSDVLIPIVDAARVYYDRFTTFLRRVFDPVIRIFDAVQRVMTKIWDKVIGPILDAIDKARQVLRLLGKLGVPFVDKIEAVLQKIQQTIFERFRQVQNWINTATFWLDLLLDPQGFIRSTPFLFTVFRFGGNMVNIITKLADLSGFHRDRVATLRSQTPRGSVDTAAGRFKSGELGKTFGLQGAAARFRSGSSGRAA